MRYSKAILCFAIAFILGTCFSQEAFSSNIRKQKLEKLVSSYSKASGFHAEKLGTFGVFGVKAMIHSYAKNVHDPRVGDFLKLVDGVEKVVILQYASGSDSDRKGFDTQMNRLLKSVEPVMTVSYMGASMKVYVVYDDSGRLLEDVILYSPDASLLACLYGHMPVESMQNLTK